MTTIPCFSTPNFWHYLASLLLVIGSSTTLLSQNPDNNMTMVDSLQAQLPSITNAKDAPTELVDYFDQDGDTTASMNLQKVPGPDPGAALRGRVTGLRVVRPNGETGSAAQMRIRSINSLSAAQDPLLVIDGVVTTGDLRDINMDDIQSVEVLKGSEAGLLYGTLGSSGVILLSTTQAHAEEQRTKFRFSSEHGTNRLTSRYPLPTLHGYQNDPDNRVKTPAPNFPWIDSNYGFELNGSGNILTATDGLFDNEYVAETYDNEGNFFSGGHFRNNHLSVTSGGQKTNYHLSFSELAHGGLVKLLPEYKRRNLKAIIASDLTDRLKLSLSASYTRASGHEPDYQSNYDIFKQVLTAHSFLNYDSFTEEDQKGDRIYKPHLNPIIISSTDNPFYTSTTISSTTQRQRFFGAISLDYELMKGMKLGFSHSANNTTSKSTFLRPRGFFSTGAIDYANGWLYITDLEQDFGFSTVKFKYDRQLSDSWQSVFSAAYQRESQTHSQVFAGGIELYPSEVVTIENSENQMGSSFQSAINAESFLTGLNLKYKDRLKITGLLRNEGVSSFGINAKRAWFYNASAEYQLADHLASPSTNDLRLRVSTGRTGVRPPFKAQYNIFRTKPEGGIPSIGESRANPDITASKINSLELGLAGSLMNKLCFDFNYENLKVKNDIIRVPTSIVTGFNSQWRNIAELKGSAIELGLGGKIIEKEYFRWNANLLWSRIRQEIISLGGQEIIDPYHVFNMRDGDAFGTMYGNQILTDLSDLTVNSNGEVTNPHSSNLGRPLTAQDFYINEDGYVIAKIDDGNGNAAEAHGSALEQVVYKSDAEGNLTQEVIGVSQPEWNISIINNIRYKGISLFFMLDHQQGGDIYNNTKQELYRVNRHMDFQTDGLRGKHIEYKNQDSAIYNERAASSHFVEDGTFTKLRELALGYALDMSKLGFVGRHLQSVEFTLIGRNLWTLTNYSGYDPEVAAPLKATTYSYDQFSYPQQKTFSARLAIGF